MIQFFIFAFLFTLTLSQTTTTSSGPECFNSSLLMTPILRKQVLDYVNDVRNTLKNGQLLLQNGEYALLPQSMPELDWSCDFEEEMYEYGNEFCNTQMLPSQNWTWLSWGTYSLSLADVVFYGTHYANINGYTANYLSQHTIYTGFAPNNQISVLHDKAEYIGCAIYDCNTGGTPSPTSNIFFCRVFPDVNFGEKVYEVSSNANAHFPSQDVICGDGHGADIPMRQMILEKINAVRQQIQQGTYILENGDHALQAINMPTLIWDCNEEVTLMDTMVPCLANNDPETIFQTTIPYTWQNWNENSLNNAIAEYLDQLYTQNPNLNFFSHSTTYSTQYPAALALSDQATTLSCSAGLCYDTEWNYNVLCLAKPSTQINDKLYQV
uniref:SCP domain-containing protein n=1 Tax=Panagrolaimus sp. PS1159 TaxID=55785 RepID=A0AC35GR27_9BILA